MVHVRQLYGILSGHILHGAEETFNRIAPFRLRAAMGDQDQHLFPVSRDPGFDPFIRFLDRLQKSLT